MDSEDRRLEANTARLIRAALGPETRPDPGAGQQALQSLLTGLRERRARSSFPDHTLAALVGTLVFMAAWLALQAIASDGAVNSPVLLLPATFVLLVNVAVVPVASIVIVLRRRHVSHA